jgi:Ca2+-binding RTX toxin-like protein
MPRFNILLCLLVGLHILMMISANPRTLAAVISCVQLIIVCEGTDNDDTMNGSDRHDNMIGKGGNDQMFGNAGDDFGEGDYPFNGGNDTIRAGAGFDTFYGDQGHDILYGGDGNDVLAGDCQTAINCNNNYGGDIIKAGPGDDKLFQSQYLESFGGEPLKSDGFKDILDCGDGNDEAWVNVNTDHDEVKNCEVVHKG